MNSLLLEISLSDLVDKKNERDRNITCEHTSPFLVLF